MECSIPGCPKPARTRGWCHGHYRRFLRHGDPLGGATAMGAVTAWLWKLSVEPPVDECIIWPFKATDAKGYGYLTIGGQGYRAGRVVLGMTEGEPIERHRRWSPYKGWHEVPVYEVCHSIDCVSTSCVNPSHLRWGTAADNGRDRVLAGTVPSGQRWHEIHAHRFK